VRFTAAPARGRRSAAPRPTLSLPARLLSRAPSAALLPPPPLSPAQPLPEAAGLRGKMALSRGLRCCQRAFAWLPVLIIALVVLWSYYAYVCELCLGERSGRGRGGGRGAPGPRPSPQHRARRRAGGGRAVRAAAGWRGTSCFSSSSCCSCLRGCRCPPGLCSGLRRGKRHFVPRPGLGGVS